MPEPEPSDPGLTTLVSPALLIGRFLIFDCVLRIAYLSNGTFSTQ